MLQLGVSGVTPDAVGLPVRSNVQQNQGWNGGNTNINK